MIDPVICDSSGKKVMKLNPMLIDRQNLSAVEVQEIKDLHLVRLQLLKEMSEFDVEDDLEQIVTWALFHEENQFALQKAWRFPQDRNFHDWFEVPHCSCPKLDNLDRKGTKYQVMDPCCPIHNHPRWVNRKGV